MALSKLAVILLAAVTAVNAQCYALCLVSECEHAAKHSQSASSSDSEDCHHRGSGPADQQSDKGPCGHEVCVSEEGQKATPVVANTAWTPPILVNVSLIVSPDDPVSFLLLEDTSPPPVASVATKAILRV